MNPNALRQWLDQLQEMGSQGGGYNAGFDPYGVLDHANKMNAGNRDAGRIFAERQAAGGDSQDQMPNFFAAMQQPAYVSPEQFHYDPARDAPPPMGGPMDADPMMGRGSPVRRPLQPTNYFASMGGR